MDDLAQSLVPWRLKAQKSSTLAPKATLSRTLAPKAKKSRTPVTLIAWMPEGDPSSDPDHLEA